MSGLRAITTVYSYYLPEVRELVTKLAAPYPHEIFLRSVSPGLDEFHVPIIERVIASHGHDVPGLAAFPNRYPTAGSEEGIREFMTELARQGVRQILMLRGDYEGFRDVARSRGIETVEVEKHADPASIPPGHWFLSNPSARDGNILPPAFVESICEAGHQLFYDLSYLGSTDPALFVVDHPNVAAAALSFSKTYGLFYSRIGFLLTRAPVPALYGNRWFKNIFSLAIADAVATSLDTLALARKYKALQAEIVATINAEHSLGLQASDAFLLAHLPLGEGAKLPPVAQAMIAKHVRATSFRFCLTPYFLEREDAASSREGS
ncbi:MAG: aminotransferase class I/II-fold pyridoxal phosphate-dependent enzyme [Thermoanaerobaculia bacterium]